VQKTAVLFFFWRQKNADSSPNCSILCHLEVWQLSYFFVKNARSAHEFFLQKIPVSCDFSLNIKYFPPFSFSVLSFFGALCKAEIVHIHL